MTAKKLYRSTGGNTVVSRTGNGTHSPVALCALGVAVQMCHVKITDGGAHLQVSVCAVMQCFSKSDRDTGAGGSKGWVNIITVRSGGCCLNGWPQQASLCRRGPAPISPNVATRSARQYRGCLRVLRPPPDRQFGLVAAVRLTATPAAPISMCHYRPG